MGWIIIIGCIIWQMRQPNRAMPSAILAGYFGLHAAIMLFAGSFSIFWLLLYAAFAYLSGKRAYVMRQKGAPW